MEKIIIYLMCAGVRVFLGNSPEYSIVRPRIMNL